MNVIVRQQSGDESTVSLTRFETSRSAAAYVALVDITLHRLRGDSAYLLWLDRVPTARVPARSRKSLPAACRCRSRASCAEKQFSSYTMQLPRSQAVPGTRAAHHAMRHAAYSTDAQHKPGMSGTAAFSECARVLEDPSTKSQRQSVERARLEPAELRPPILRLAAQDTRWRAVQLPLNR